MLFPITDAEGFPQLLGRRVYLSPSMPAATANLLPVAYGDMSRFVVRRVRNGLSFKVFPERYAEFLQTAYETHLRIQAGLAKSANATNNLPPESQLIDDLTRLVRLYTNIVSDPIEATVDQLLEAVVEPASNVEVVDGREFEARAPWSARGVGGLRNGGRAFSRESRNVGDAGEKLVRDYERKRLSTRGRPDLSDRVRWHAKEFDFPGWDITSFNDEGDEICIEVKSSVGKTFASLGITANEWEAATNPKRRERYYIYLVTSALQRSLPSNACSTPPHLSRAGKFHVRLPFTRSA